MACDRELAPMKLDLTFLSSEYAYVWDSQWQLSTGVSTVDFLVDLRNR